MHACTIYHETFVAGIMRLSGKLLFCLEAFVVARDWHKNYVCDRIIRYETFMVVRKTTRSTKVSCQENFVLYDICTYAFL